MGLILDLAVAALVLVVIGSLSLLAWTLAVSSVRAVGEGRRTVAEARRTVRAADARLTPEEDAALSRLRKDHEESGRVALFEALKVYLTGDSGAPSLREVASRLSMTEGAVKVAIHRLRERYRQALREEIDRT